MIAPNSITGVAIDHARWVRFVDLIMRQSETFPRFSVKIACFGWVRLGSFRGQYPPEAAIDVGFLEIAWRDMEGQFLQAALDGEPLKTPVPEG